MTLSRIAENRAFGCYSFIWSRKMVPSLLLLGILLFVLSVPGGAVGENSQLEEHMVDHDRIINNIFYHLYGIDPDEVFKRSEFASVADTAPAWRLISELKQNKVLILPSYALGLANRLRTISSMSVLAKELNRTLIVLWIRSYECNANSADLFSLVHPGGADDSSTAAVVMIDVAASIGNAEEGWLELYPSQELISHYVTRLSMLRNDVIAFYQSLVNFLERVQESEPGTVVAELATIGPVVQVGIERLAAWKPLAAIFRKPPAFDVRRSNWEHPADILIAWSLTTHQFTGGSGGEDEEDTAVASYNAQRRDAFYRHLVPAPTVRSLLEKYRAKFKGSRGKHLVGVHLRAYQARYDWNMVTPVVRTHQWGRVTPDISSCDADTVTEYIGREEQQSVALRFDESASMEDFVVTLGRLIKKGATVLLISNSNEVKERMVKRFNRAGGAINVVALVDGDVSVDATSCDSTVTGSCDPDLTATESRSSERSSAFGMQLAMADMFAVGGYLDKVGESSESGGGGPAFLVPELIVHTKGSSLAAEASVMRDVPLAAIVTTVHPPPSNERQVSYILSAPDSLHRTLRAMDSDASARDVVSRFRSIERIRTEYVAICGTGGANDEADPVRRNMSPRLRSRCDSMKACYVETADRCICTLLLKYTPCSVSELLPLALVDEDYRSEPENWLVEYLFDRESSMYCLDQEYHDLRRVQADTQPPRVRGYGGDLLWVYAETTGQGL
jgi:hypothetical protein